MLLVASPDLADPRFRQSVLLVLRHGRGGPLAEAYRNIEFPMGLWLGDEIVRQIS